jgi:AcrR family transcriptional regulator
MKGPKSKAPIDTSTEEKIKTAARTIFTQKGYAATRTRDIAEEAGINLALLNYYFRSKEKLFDMIMLESMHDFIHSIAGIFNDETTTLEEKFQLLVNNYIDMLIAQPNLPLFVLSELRTNPGHLVSKLNLKENLANSFFLKQIHVAIKEGKIPPIHPLHFIMNMMSLIVFPFIASPMLRNIGDLSEEEYNALMQQRKTFIPKWINAMMAVK